MSLKAKIEAVIYASEEPVTLAQLVGLLGHEAQAELDALASRQMELVDGGSETEEGPADATAPTEARAEDAGVEEMPAGPAAPETDEAKQLAADKRAVRDAERRLREYLNGFVQELIREYATADRGLELREVAGGLRLGTKPEYHDAVRGFVRS